MVYIPSALFDNERNRINRPSSAEVTKYGGNDYNKGVSRRELLKYLGMGVGTAAAAVLLDACGGSGSGGGGTPTSPGPTSGKVAISGNITDRITGGQAGSGSIIEYKNKRTGATARANISDGRYEIRDLDSGDYQVTISGGSHVTHSNMAVPVSNSGDLSFSVIGWGSGKFGVVYDQQFDRFFYIIARYASDTIGIQKWNLQQLPPREFYITNEGLSPRALDEFLSILNEVNNESIPDMFAGRVGPLAINVGPRISDYKDGSYVITFQDGPSSNTGRSVLPGTNIIKGSRILFSIPGYEVGGTATRQAKKSTMAHEVFHGAYAYHPLGDYNMGLPSLMGADMIVGPTPYDKLASWIVYNDDTRPGNRPPDVNMNYI